MSTLVSTHGGYGPTARAPKAVAGVARPGKAAGRKAAVASFLSRWVETYQKRQQERAIEALMDLDPRVRDEIAAAQARANGGW